MSLFVSNVCIVVFAIYINGRTDQKQFFSDLCEKNLPLWEFTAHFVDLASFSHLDDASLKTIYWIGANYSQAVE